MHFIRFALLVSSMLFITVLGHLHHECAHDDPSTQRALYGLHHVGEAVEGAKVIELGRRRPFAGADGSAEGPEEVRTTLMSEQRYAGDAKDRAFRAAASSPIRIVFRLNNLDDSTKYCTSASGTSPDMQGGTVACSAETVFNATHKQFLTEVVLPRAAAILSGFLSVVPISGNLMVPSSASLCNSQYTKPAADSSTGVANADFVIYVSAAPTTGSTIAWAGYCSLDSNGRPVVARSNFSPKYLNAKTATDIDYVVRVGVHELLHALGFSGTHIQSPEFGLANAIKSSTRRGGQPVSIYTGSGALNALRANTGCSTTDGVEIEDEGGSGTAGSHWERRNHKEDVMCGIAGSVMTFSEMTFGLLEDSGHYTIDRTRAETEYYMKGAGCGVFDSFCNTTEGGRGSYFCFESGSACSPDFNSFGPCQMGTYSADLPSYYQFFPGSPKMGGTAQLMNYCPSVLGYSNRQCNKYDNSQANISSIGLYFGSDGRCFKTTSTLYKGGSAENGPARCFKSRCPYGTRIEFLVGDSTVWTACPTDGTVGVVAAPSPYTGEVTCPLASAFCTTAMHYLPAGASTTTKATTTTPTTTKATSTTPTTTKTTTTTPTTTKTTTTTPTTTKTTTTTPTTTKTTTTTPIFTTKATTTTPTTTTKTTTTAPTTTKTTTTTTRTSTTPTTTAAPVLRALVIELSSSAYADDFIAAFLRLYNLTASSSSSPATVVFLRFATAADEAKVSSQTAGGSTKVVIGFSSTESAVAAEDLVTKLPTDSQMRALLGASAAAETDVASEEESSNALSHISFVVIIAAAGGVVLLLVIVGVLVACYRKKKAEIQKSHRTFEPAMDSATDDVQKYPASGKPVYV